MTLLDSLRTQLSDGLIRKSATTCSRWAQTYITLGKPIPGPLSFERHPWSKEWHDYSGDWVGAKAAQMAMTQSALHRALFTIDVRKNSVLYLFPKKSPDATDFSKDKFDTILNLSPHIGNMFSSVRNVGHKQTKSGISFFLRGMRSRSGLKSISVGLKVYDEYDEMNQKAVALADERSSGYEEEDKQTIKLSTPTVPEYGISDAILQTTQDHWFFKCPLCGRRTEFIYPECLEITSDNIRNEKELKRSFLKCYECRRPLSHEAKREYLGLRNAKWESTVHGHSQRGFQINQLYSTTMPPWEIAKVAILARTDQSYETELFNSKLGLPHVLEGARITDQMLAACLDAHSVNDRPRQGFITMGVDVGHKVLYCWIDLWLLPPAGVGADLNSQAIPFTLKCFTVPGFEHLDAIMREYQVNHCTVDVDPAFRDALLFARRFPGAVSMCRFVRTIGPRNISPGDKEADVVKHVNRTYWLDISQGRFRRGKKGIILPRDQSEDASRHLKALIRHEKKDDEGNLVAKYISVGADHFAFARVYSEIALPLAVSIGEGRDIKEFL